MDLDALSESARNRGLKLVRSRVRTPGKRGYGKVGVTDASGKPVFGFDGKELSATPEEAEQYLRGLGAGDWGASLDEPDARPRKSAKKQAANDDEVAAPRKPKRAPKPAPKPKPPPRPATRKATVKDAPRLLPLLRLLGYSLDERAFAKRLAKMIKSDCAPLVATIGDRIVGLCGVQLSTMLQREKPVGRLSVLVVAEAERGKSIGRMLVEAAETHFRKAGCELIEVTSNDRHLAAHAFYRRMGYERTSIRFAKSL
jgi:ribosomal protein S18 acetylase RimI-like enzyme